MQDYRDGQSVKLWEGGGLEGAITACRPDCGSPDRYLLPCSPVLAELSSVAAISCFAPARPHPFSAQGMGNGVAMVMRLGMPSLGSPRDSLTVIPHTGRHESSALHTHTPFPHFHTCLHVHRYTSLQNIGHRHTRAHTDTQACRSAYTLKPHSKAEGSRSPHLNILQAFHSGPLTASDGLPKCSPRNTDITKDNLQNLQMSQFH